MATNALLINGLMLSAFALDGLAHAVEALSGQLSRWGEVARH